MKKQRNEKALQKLDALIKREENHFQWDKHGICAFILLCQVIVGLMRGSSVY
jgi:hypothetical protein